MNRTGSKRSFIALILLTLFLSVALPVTSFGKHKGRRYGRGQDFDNWKCGRFVNCHDARDGRWDGRGRRRNTASYWDWRNNRRDRWDDGWWTNGSSRTWWDNQSYQGRRYLRSNDGWRNYWSRNVRWRRN